ncbi:MAG: hypothetical protein DPW09_28650 [Anaerolineae bacterium]|nr:hypothetical protein [Anaerolineae bacterium]
MRRGGGVGPRGVGVAAGTVGGVGVAVGEGGIGVGVDEEADKRAVAVNPALSGVAEVNGEGVPSAAAAPGVAEAGLVIGDEEDSEPLSAEPLESGSPGVAEFAAALFEAVPLLPGEPVGDNEEGVPCV